MGTQLIPAAQTQITFPSLVNVEGPSPVLAEFPFLLWQQRFFPTGWVLLHLGRNVIKALQELAGWAEELQTGSILLGSWGG